MCEIPEVARLCDEMFAEWDKIPERKGGKDLLAQKKRDEIEKKYWPKFVEAYNRYKQEHPDEFKDEN